MSAAVSAGARKAYGSYWNGVVEQWDARRLDEPTPSETRQLVAHVKAHAVPRRNARGGRSAAENLFAALRCLYRHAQDDGLIDERDNPARNVEEPRDLTSTRRAVNDARLAQINQIAATTGDDPELDTPALRRPVGPHRQAPALVPHPADQHALDTAHHLDLGCIASASPSRKPTAAIRTPTVAREPGPREGPTSASASPKSQPRSPCRPGRPAPPPRAGRIGADVNH